MEGCRQRTPLWNFVQFWSRIIFSPLVISRKILKIYCKLNFQQNAIINSKDRKLLFEQTDGDLVYSYFFYELVKVLAKKRQKVKTLHSTLSEIHLVNVGFLKRVAGGMYTVVPQGWRCCVLTDAVLQNWSPCRSPTVCQFWPLTPGRGLFLYIVCSDFLSLFSVVFCW